MTTVPVQYGVDNFMKFFYMLQYIDLTYNTFHSINRFRVDIASFHIKNSMNLGILLSKAKSFLSIINILGRDM